MGGGGKKGGTPSYVANNDYLIAFGPIWNVWAAWRNGTLYGYTPSQAGEFIEASRSSIGSHTFTVLAGDWNLGLTGWGTSGSVSPSGGHYLDGIIAITNTYAQTASFNDYGGSGPVVETATVTQYLYNVAGTPGFPSNIAWRPNSQWLGAPLHNGGQCVFGIGSSRGSAGWVVTMPSSWTPVDSTITVYWGQTLTGHHSPMAALGYQFEAELGSLAAGGGATPPWTYPDLSGLYAPNQDLGSAGTTPNDNFEMQGLYSLTPEMQCNPVDIILDIIVGGNVFFSPADITDPFIPVAASTGLDFGSDPNRADPVTGEPYSYPPMLAFPHVVQGYPPAGVTSVLEDSPIYNQQWNSSKVYPTGAIVFKGLDGGD